MKAQKQEVKPFPLLRIGLAVLVGAILIWSLIPIKKTNTTVPAESQAPHTATTEEVERMLHAILDSMNPILPENGSVPPVAAEKFSWAMQQNGQRILRFDPDYSNDAEHGFAAVSYLDHKPIMKFFMQPITQWAMEDFRARRPFNRTIKANMYYAFAHEVRHLERGPEFMDKVQPRAVQIEEEMRVWAMCNTDVVRPFIKLGYQKELFTGLLDVDNLLTACNDDWQHCPAFREYISSHYQ